MLPNCSQCVLQYWGCRCQEREIGFWGKLPQLVTQPGFIGVSFLTCPPRVSGKFACTIRLRCKAIPAHSAPQKHFVLNFSNAIKNLYGAEVNTVFSRKINQ